MSAATALAIEESLSPDSLAVVTGEPIFKEPLHVGRPNIGSEEALICRIRQMLQRRWLTNAGPMVAEFEEKLKALLGVKHCIPVCNGTVALELAIRAAELKGEVIVPSFTFIATAHALQWQEITPVFCDVGSGSHNIDPGQIEGLITPRTTGIIGVHVWGKPCNHLALAHIAQRNGLTLMYDASHAFGNSHCGKMIGNFGLCEIFSFHATKVLNCFEGGAIATNDDSFARKIRLMQNFGFSGLDQVIYIGTNGKMSEVSAAMGLTGLESFDYFCEFNRVNHETYCEELNPIPGITIVCDGDNGQRNYQYVIVEVDDKVTGISRDDILTILRAENILARRYFYPGCHRMEPYKSYFPHAGLLLPRTEQLTKRVLVLPTGTAVTPDDIRLICKIIRTAVRNPAECRGYLSRRSA